MRHGSLGDPPGSEPALEDPITLAHALTEALTVRWRQEDSRLYRSVGVRRFRGAFWGVSGTALS